MQENKTSTSTYRRFLQLKMITKYGIFGLAGFSLTYCILTSLGYYVPWMFIAFFTFAFVLRLVLSKTFGLCFVHRSCILYNYCVSLCIVTKPETIQELFGVSKGLIVDIFVLIGAFIFCLVVWKIANKKNC